jgi:CheY-like chemotaxis protein
MAKILVIDDDPKMRRIVSAILERAGHEIHEAVNGLEGLSVAAREFPDLVICDLMMPVMGGVETVQLIRKDKVLADLPVIIMTSNSEEETIIDVLDLGISYFFAKPVDFAKLKSKVQEVVRTRQGNRRKDDSSSHVKPYVKRPEGEQIVVVCASDEDLLDAFGEALENDYEIIRATDGATCLNSVLHERPDAVLIEYNSAVISASEVTARIRKTTPISGIKVLALVEPGDSEAAGNANLFDALIPADSEPESVVEELRQALSDCHFTTQEDLRATTVKFKAGGLKWAAGNHDEAARGIDEMLARIADSGKNTVTLDIGGVRENEAEFDSIVFYTIGKARELNLKVALISGFEHIASDIDRKGYDNVTIIKPASTG